MSIQKLPKEVLSLCFTHVDPVVCLAFLPAVCKAWRDVLEFMKDSFSREECCDAFSKAVCSNFFISAYFILDVTDCKPSCPDVLVLCCQEKNVKGAEWLHKTGLCSNFSGEVQRSQLYKMCWTNSLVAVRWYVNTYDTANILDPSLLHNVLYISCTRSLELVQFIIAHFHMDARLVTQPINNVRGSPFYAACRHNRLHTAEWFVQHFHLTGGDVDVDMERIVCTSRTYMKSADWLSAHLGKSFVYTTKIGEMVNEKCLQGDMHSVEWFYSRYGIQAFHDERAYHLFLACKKGHLRMAKWFLQTHDMRADDIPGPILSHRFHVPILDLLHKHLNLGLEHVRHNRNQLLTISLQMYDLHKVEWLLGILDQSDIDGESVLDVCLEYDDPEMADLVRSKGFTFSDYSVYSAWHSYFRQSKMRHWLRTNYPLHTSKNYVLK